MDIGNRCDWSDSANSLFQELGSNWLDWTALDLTKLPSRHRREVRSEIADILLADYPTSRLWVVKDPRICRYAKMFLQSLDEANVHVCPIIALRNPLEVCASLAQRTAFWSSDLTRMDAALLWLRHMLEAEAATRNRARVIVSYSALLDDWPQVLTRNQSRTCSELAPFDGGDRRSSRRLSER